jgi:uncharacterized membrane protein YdbT with pleckstrin-like domain
MYIVSLLVFAAIAIAGYLRPPLNPWFFVFPGLILAWTIRCHFELLLTSLTVDGEFLRYESGLLSRTTRTVEIGKVQDVRVDQTIGQRLMGTGNLSVETAGGSSHLSMPDIDRPHEIAAQVLKLSSAQSAKGQSAS